VVDGTPRSLEIPSSRPLKKALAEVLQRPILRILCAGKAVGDADTLDSLGHPDNLIVSLKPKPTKFVLGNQIESLEIDYDLPFSNVLTLVAPHFEGVSKDDIVGVFEDEIDPYTTLRQLKCPSVVNLRRKFTFSMDGTNYSLSLSGRWQFSQARESFGVASGVDPSEVRFFADGKEIADDAVSTLDAHARITVERKVQKVSFEFEKEKHEIDVDCRRVFSAVKPDVVTAFRRNDITIFHGDEEVGDVTTLADLGYPKALSVRLTRVSPTRFVLGTETRLVNIDRELPLSQVLAIVAPQFRDVRAGDLVCVGSHGDLDLEQTLASIGGPAKLELRVKPPPETVFVFEAHEYRLAVPSDASIGTVLPQLAAKIGGVTSEDLVVALRGKDIDPQRTLAEIGEPHRLELRQKPPPETVFVFGTREFRLAIRRNVPIATVFPQLAAQIGGISPDDLAVIFEGKEVAARTLAELGEPSGLEVQRKAGSETVFVFDRREYRLVVPPGEPLSEVIQRLAGAVGIPAAEIDLFLGKAQVDPAMTLTDLDYPNRISVVRNGPVDLKLDVTCSFGIIPLIKTVRVSPRATLAESESVIKQQCGVSERATEFAELDPAGNTRKIEGNRLASEFVNSQLTLVLRPAGARIENPEPLHRSLVRADAEPPPVSGDEIEIPFIVPKPIDRQFRLRFSKVERIAVARDRVAVELGMDPETITLMFCGKALNVDIILGRLRLGRSPITVYVKLKAEIFLISARAIGEPE
jgi:hypothetical protein